MASLPDQQQWIAVMSQSLTHDEKAYFKALGARIAQRREELGLTQVQVSKALGIAQQRYASYEVGSRRVQVSMIPALSRALMTDAESLLGITATPSKRGPAPRFQQHLERIGSLPKSQQQVVLKMLEGALAQSR